MTQTFQAKPASIIFDVDSTLVTIEGIDYLARQKGCFEKVAATTKQAMAGEIPFHQALAQRLNAIRPNQQDVIDLGQAYINNLVPHAADTIAQLSSQGHDVWLLSGGFNPAVSILGLYLNIPQSRVMANRLHFDSAGYYLGYDQNFPLAQTGGKLKIIRQLGSQLHKPIVIGDGATDLETKPYVHRFIGFGGVVRRPVVQKQADVYLSDLVFASLAPYLDQRGGDTMAPTP